MRVFKKNRHSGKIAFSCMSREKRFYPESDLVFAERNPNRISHKVSFAYGEEKVLRNDVFYKFKRQQK